MRKIGEFQTAYHSAPTGVRILAAGESLHHAEAKVFTTGPPVVPYTSRVGAGLSSTWLPPSIAIHMWLCKMLKKRVEERRVEHCGGQLLTVFVMCEYHIGVTTLRELSGVTLTSAPTRVQTLAAGEPQHQKQRP